MDFLSADTLPWLHGSQQRVRAALSARRLPHALLLLSVPGLGAEQLANWIAALTLCESDSLRPCGACASCHLLRADNHPDCYVVRIEEDAQQIKVDQIRHLIESLSLSSYRGGYKVGIVEAAEALNANGANAFLKTLEEPTDNTILIMVAKPSHRLPATVASRCMRVQLRAPAGPEAIAWLEGRGEKRQNWDAALELAGGAPLLALELETLGVGALEKEMQEHLRQMVAGEADVTLLAAAWVKSGENLRLIWLENWITWRIHAYLGAATSLQSAEPVCLPAALLKPKMQNLFELLDAIGRFKRLAATGMNQQLALEALLLGGRAALAS